MRAITQAIFLAVALLVLCVPTRAQYSANYQTNIISAVTSNWPGDYFVGSNTFADVLIVCSNATLKNSSGYLGYLAGSSNNAAIVTGTGSVWSNSSDLYIGYYGAGNQLTVSNAALVRNYTGYIGYNTNSDNNTVLLTGAGSTWNNAYLYVGRDAAGNRLTVSNSAFLRNSNYGYIGYNANSSNNAVLVTGSSSIWSNSYDLYVGFLGAGNQLTVSDGAFLKTSDGHIGGYLVSSARGSNNAALITGIGSVWDNGDLYIGDNGAGNRLTVSDRALVRNSTGYIGRSTNSSDNAVLVTDAGSVWSNSLYLYVGRDGAGNRLTVSNGALLRNSYCYIGYNAGSSNNTVLVTGSGSVWSHSYDLYIGDSGTGNQLTISDRALVRNSSGYIGVDANNNTALVTGTGSVWSNSSDLYVGFNGSTNQLRIVEGGIAFAGSAYIGLYPYVGGVGNSIWLSNGTLAVSSLSISNGNTLSGGGTVTGNVLNRGTLSADGGTLSILGSVINYGALGALNGGIAEFFSTVLDLGNTNFSGGNAVFHGLYLKVTNSTNAWANASSGLWREDARWSLGVAPTNTQSYLVITNANTKTVTVDAPTPPWSLTNWSTTVSAPAGSTNTLSVETPDWAMANITAGRGGRLRITNATVTVGLAGVGTLGVDGELTINTGTLDASAVVVTLGGNGTATVSFANGVLMGRNCRIGGATTGGVVIASGSGFWQQQGDLWIGTNTSRNSLLIDSGLQVTNTNGYIGYRTSGSNNMVVVTGTGSVWGNSSNLYIGWSGAGNRLTVSNGALVRNSEGRVGVSANNNVVLVTGTGSVWSNSSGLSIGGSGASNWLTVSNGARVSSDWGVIGEDPGNRSNAVLVTGAGSVWNNSSNLFIGYYSGGGGNHLTVSNGARVQNSTGYIGCNGSSNNAVLVTGSGSVWSNSSDLYIGYSGAGNRLTVSNGARVQNSTGYITAPNLYPGDTNNAVLVTGSGSVWNNSSNLYIGGYAGGNRLTISGGALVRNFCCYIGLNWSSSSNMVLVTDTGSVWSNSADLYIGNDGAGNRLTVSNGALVIASNVVVGVSDLSTDNEVTVSGGKLIASNATGAALMDARRGTLTLNNGTITAKTLLLSTTNATLTGTGQIIGSVSNNGFVTPGVLSVSSNFNAGAFEGGLRVKITGPNTCSQLNVGKTANLGGDLSVILDGYTPRSGEIFVPITATSVGGSFTTTNLPSIWPGLSWLLECLSTVVRLSVTGRVVLANYDLYASYYNLGPNSELNDANNNGIANLMEYGLGRDPTSGVYRAATTQNRSNGWFQIQFTRNTDATNLAYRVEAANVLTNGGDWSCILSNINNTGWSGPASPPIESTPSNGIAEVTVTDIAPGATNRFLRLRVTRP